MLLIRFFSSSLLISFSEKWNNDIVPVYKKIIGMLDTPESINTIEAEKMAEDYFTLVHEYYSQIMRYSALIPQKEIADTRHSIYRGLNEINWKFNLYKIDKLWLVKKEDRYKLWMELRTKIVSQNLPVHNNLSVCSPTPAFLR